MQEADQNVCALFVFQQKDAAVGFFWDKAGLTSIVFFNEQWNFPPSETTVAVRIGNNWISENGGIDWFQATEKKNALVVPIRYDPVESCVRPTRPRYRSARMLTLICRWTKGRCENY